MSTMDSDENVLYLLQHNGHFWAMRPTAAGTTLSAFLAAARQNTASISWTPVGPDGLMDAPLAPADGPAAPGETRCCVERENVEAIRDALRQLDGLLPRCDA